MRRIVSLLFPALLLFTGCDHSIRNPTEPIRKFHYDLVKGWPSLPQDLPIGNPTGLDIDTEQHLFVFYRAYDRQWTNPFPDTVISAPTILELDGETGYVLNKWGAGMFIMPHGLTVDRWNNVWVTDVALQQVFKFTHDGKLLMTLGEKGKPGNDSAHFNMPTDVAVAADGSFYVSDGYGNSRVIKFSADGKFLFEWGKKGSHEGEFNIPHAIDLDSAGNVYVADRENSRVVIFTPNGKYISAWNNADSGKMYAVSISPVNNLPVGVDFLIEQDTIIKGSDIILFDEGDSINTRIGKSGSYAGETCRYHDITIDRNGNIYVGDILHHRIQKFNCVQDK